MSKLFTTALGKDAHTFSRTAGSITTRDVKRLYKEMMKAAMTVSNPKVRIIVYDSIRHEFKARRHMTDAFAVSEAMTRGCNDLESLRDQRVHPFLHLNEDGLVSAPKMSDPNAPALFYTPGPVLSLMYTMNFVIFGGFFFGYFYGWYLGLDPRGGLYDDKPLDMHKGIPRTFEGNTLNWQYDAPTGPELRTWRSNMLTMRTQEADLEAQLLDLEAKLLAKSLALRDDYEAEQAQAQEQAQAKKSSFSLFGF